MDSLLIPIQIFLMLSVRTPKETSPLDYLFETQLSKPDTFLIATGLERELGNYYSSQEYFYIYTYKNLYLREYFIDNYKYTYNQLDFRARFKPFSFGYAYRHGHKAVIALNWLLEPLFVNIEQVTDFNEADWKVNTGVEWEKVKVELIFRSPDYVQFKTGLKINLH